MKDRSEDAVNEPLYAEAETKYTFPVKYSVVPRIRGRSISTRRLFMHRHTDLQRDLNHPNSSTPYKPTPQPPSQSYVEEFLPFKSEPLVREDYINVYGKIRIGRIFEDLDALAGSIAYAHCDDGRHDAPPLAIVTASVDRITLLTPYFISGEDIKLSGFVSYVGKSSMEVSIRVETCSEGVESAIDQSIQDREDGKWPVDIFSEAKGTAILLAKFTMVARDPVTGRAATVNSLELNTETERALFKSGQEQKARKKAASKQALSIKPPSIDEMYLIHDLHLETKKHTNELKPDSIIWMNDTEKSSILICMPQDRNIHNNIFGGYLMRKAFELAHVCSVFFAGKEQSFSSLDEIMFKKPVPIGSILALSSMVVCSWETGFSVRVTADVIDPFGVNLEAKERTNEFYFTFKGNAVKRRVAPRSYEESMLYIEGLRRKAVGDAL